MDIPEKDEPVAHAGKKNLKYNGSDLYDSFELQEMAHQLNKAIQASNASSSAYQDMKFPLSKAIQRSNASSPSYVFNLNSPLYLQRLNRIYQEGAKTPRKISHRQVPQKRAGKTARTVAGFTRRLWMKIKQGLLGKSKSGEGRNRR
ncbi:hypothetical protein L6164_011228 [Bauhinia variegata]|uniref:Uncharacterized protein n=1 Tax=Bauhinia variegata TaxID=167791 RepID=A0ACB9PAG3_BAUVA|nr:hypothetical protein L6164_011228 [Bauhinia variegata]